jgi:hypothetical protein
MNINKILEPFAEFISPETKRVLNSAIEFLPEEISNVLPSIQVNKDGLTLSSLLLVTNSYLCELHLMEAPNTCGFDFTAKHTIFNYRIKTWTHEIKEEEVVKAKFELAEVILVHAEVEKFTTKISFAGSAEDRSAWLKNLIQAIPIKIVLGFARPIS